MSESKLCKTVLVGCFPHGILYVIQAIAEHYNTKLSNGHTPVQDRVKSLESDAEPSVCRRDCSCFGVCHIMLHSSLPLVTHFKHLKASMNKALSECVYMPFFVPAM